MGRTTLVGWLFWLSLILSLSGVPFFAVAQTPAVCNDSVVGKTESELQADLLLCNAEIARWQGVLNDTRNRADSIDSNVQALTAKIKAAEATIKSKNIAITQLSSDISIRTLKIKSLETSIEEGRHSLAKLMRDTYQLDNFTLAEVVLQSQNFSDFFSDMEAFSAIQSALENRLNELQEHVSWTEVEREKLNEVQRQELDAKYEVEINKKNITVNQKEQREVLAATQQEAKTYEQIVADRQAKASQINAALFRLRGVDGGGIPFKEALAYAETAAAKTGVRTAFILGILRQESDRGDNGNFGVNVGQCLLVDAKTGDGKGKNTGTPFTGLMKVDRDVAPFISLMQRLGRDPYNTPVSCSGPGWYGGGMGPTQFIPSTWQIFEARIAQAFNVSVGDPWNPQHAIMATSIYLQELGAAQGGYSAEREAAGRYYAGGDWKARGLEYAASVLRHTETYQTNIDFLENR